MQAAAIRDTSTLSHMACLPLRSPLWSRSFTHLYPQTIYILDSRNNYLHQLPRQGLFTGPHVHFHLKSSFCLPPGKLQQLVPPQQVLHEQHQLYASFLDHSGRDGSRNILKAPPEHFAPFLLLNAAHRPKPLAPELILLTSPDPRPISSNLRQTLQSQALAKSLFQSYILGKWALKKNISSVTRILPPTGSPWILWLDSIQFVGLPGCQC